jgi:hypothetical protein
MKKANLVLEELEERIAPSTLGESNGNPGNEVSNGASPQPSGGDGGGTNGESNGNPGNEVSNGASPEPSGG